MDMGLDIDDLTTKASKEIYTEWCDLIEAPAYLIVLCVRWMLHRHMSSRNGGPMMANPQCQPSDMLS